MAAGDSDKIDYHPLRWYDPILLATVPPLVGVLISSLMHSYRLSAKFGEKAAEAALKRSGGRAVYATWHQRMSYHFHYFGKLHLLMMISGSRDGEYAARLASCAGFRYVRGSSTRGGSQALKDMVGKLNGGFDSAGMLADGPQGPPRVVKMGSLIIARDTGLPLIGVLWGADRCWTFNSWDRYLVPKPFSRIVIKYTKPMWIPTGTSGPALEDLRVEFERRLNGAARFCDLYFGSEHPWRRAKSDDTPEIGPIK
ncbi:MAG: lysophospholipid acyltransferase family protein [Desulfatiglandaceae bacterium]